MKNRTPTSGQNEKKDDFYETTLKWLIDSGVLSREMNMLVVCGGQFDRDVLLTAGFTQVTISNLDSRLSGNTYSPFRWCCQDAEKLDFPDDEYDFCIAHNGLHHCASPHRALLEMFRVAKKGVLVFEPRDTLLVRLGIRFNFGQDYETASVEGDGLGFGGMRNTGIPNYVYRWTEREIEKTIRSFSPWGEPSFLYRYSLRVPWARLRAMRNKTFLLFITAFLPLLKFLCFCFPKQSNGFAFAIVKPSIPTDVLPWLKYENGRITMNRDWMEREYALQGDRIKT
jgi:SAM-dependent methyltransferase